jgi:hypothetical protein
MSRNEPDSLAALVANSVSRVIGHYPLAKSHIGVVDLAEGMRLLSATADVAARVARGGGMIASAVVAPGIDMVKLHNVVASHATAVATGMGKFHLAAILMRDAKARQEPVELSIDTASKIIKDLCSERGDADAETIAWNILASSVLKLCDLGMANSDWRKLWLEHYEVPFNEDMVVVEEAMAVRVMTQWEAMGFKI